MVGFQHLWFDASCHGLGVLHKTLGQNKSGFDRPAMYHAGGFWSAHPVGIWEVVGGGEWCSLMGEVVVGGNRQWRSYKLARIEARASHGISGASAFQNPVFQLVGGVISEWLYV